MFSLFLLALGILLLYAGGELLVSNSAYLARIWGISPLVVGLTVVALGTSSPELAAVLVAALRDQHDVALGGVIGSNISNIGFILGSAAIVCPIMTITAFIRREVPFMILVSGLLVWVIWNNQISRIEGLILFLLLLGYLWVLIYESRRDRNRIPMEELTAIPRNRSIPLALLGVVAGIVCLSGGAHSLVEGAVRIAEMLGVPQKVIGLTLVAFGTSLPEFSSCIVAAYRNESEIVLGNVIGSNVFNVLCIVGASTIIMPITVSFATILSDLIIMIFFSLLILPVLATNLTIGRIEGTILLLMYLGYVVTLFMGYSLV